MFKLGVEHIDGIIVLLTSLLIPLAIWLGNRCKEEILEEAVGKLNGLAKRLENEINIMKEQIALLKQNVNYVDSKQDMVNDTIKQQLETLTKELEKLETLKFELQGTRELMLLQNNSFMQQLIDFKEFVKINLFGDKTNEK